MRKDDRERALSELNRRVIGGVLQQAESGGQSLEEVLAESVFYERARLRFDLTSPTRDHDMQFWNRAASRLGKAGDRELRGLVYDVVGHYGREICGRFDDRIYGMASKMVPPALGLLLNATSPKRLLGRRPQLPDFDSVVALLGETEAVQRLNDRGTLLFVPTHVSNLDSVVLGFALQRLGLPPALYGAGINLFTNPLLGFFLRNLGAYRVDRLKKDPLYKNVLKAYATLALEYGYNGLFFPGGTRSRAGAVENKLKLGLMGTGLSAYINNLRSGKRLPNVYVVPVSVSFQLVLEAETLIDDFLRDVGKSRYIISDDEFAKPRRVFDFLSQLLSLNADVAVTFGEPRDVFGNRVDDDGNSLDPCGRHVDTTRYVTYQGDVCARPQRDAEYTRELGERVVESLRRHTVLHSTHVLARAVFDGLRHEIPGVDAIRLVRVGARDVRLDLRDVYWHMRKLLDALRASAHAGHVRLSRVVQYASAEDVVADGLRYFSIYHARPAVERRGDVLVPTDRALLFYYQNRLEGYGLERMAMRAIPSMTDDVRRVA